MLIVADSSALISLAFCDGLCLLDQLFDEVKVPFEVFEEINIKGKPAANILKSYLTNKIISVDITKFVIATSGLGQGELAAMALYKHLQADYLLIDDKRARKIAQLNHINITGSQGILLLAKQAALIDNVSVFINKLRNSDIYISERLIQKTLQLAGE